MAAFDLVTFGEPLISFIAGEIGPLHGVRHFQRSLAGAEVNVAIGMARLGYKVGYVSRVGNDVFGEMILNALRSEGIDTRLVGIDRERPTGFQLKSRVVVPDPDVVYFRQGSAASSLAVEPSHSAYFASARHAHLTGIPLALSPSSHAFSEQVLSICSGAGKTVSFDPNLRPQLWPNRQEMIDTVNRIACRVDWVLPGLSEGTLLTGHSSPGDIAEFYLDRGVRVVVIKLGPAGAYYRTKDEEGYADGFSVQSVDTVGAGDGFAVGFISGMLDGLSLRNSVDRANAAGAMTVMSREDFGLAGFSELNQFMCAHRTSATMPQPVE